MQEWNLLDDADKVSYANATDALWARLDPGNKTLAAQDFRHTSQSTEESVADFIRHLERTFRVAYGRDGLAASTRDALLHGQLHEGLRYEIMRGPAVSGAQTYKELCVAAKNEERRLAELRMCQQYNKTHIPSSQDRPSKRVFDGKQVKHTTPKSSSKPTPSLNMRKCYNCNKPGHLARDCRSKRSESGGRPLERPKPTGTRQVQSGRTSDPTLTQGRVNPLSPPPRKKTSSYAKSELVIRAVCHSA